MIQAVLTYIIIALAVAHALYNGVKLFLPSKNASGGCNCPSNGACSTQKVQMHQKQTTVHQHIKPY